MHSAQEPENEKIAYIKKLRSELKMAENELFLSLSRRVELHKHHEQKSSNLSLIVLIGSSIMMIIFVLSGVVIKPNMSETYTTLPTNHSKAPSPSFCAQNDGDFDACVTGQRQGSGCSWYAACNKCIPDEDKDSLTICK